MLVTALANTAGFTPWSNVQHRCKNEPTTGGYGVRQKNEKSIRGNNDGIQVQNMLLQ
jgi:hypothetical protein